MTKLARTYLLNNIYFIDMTYIFKTITYTLLTNTVSDISSFKI